MTSRFLSGLVSSYLRFSLVVRLVLLWRSDFWRVLFFFFLTALGFAGGALRLGRGRRPLVVPCLVSFPLKDSPARRGFL